jgi:hypothetical protein
MYSMYNDKLQNCETEVNIYSVTIKERDTLKVTKIVSVVDTQFV